MASRLKTCDTAELFAKLVGSEEGLIREWTLEDTDLFMQRFARLVGGETAR